MSVYVGKNGSKKEAVSLYIGKNGTKKEVTEAYYGSSKKKVYSYKADPGQQVFTESGTFTVPKGVKSVDIFLVGGGAGGGTTYHPYEGTSEYWAGNGGGGGYTKTIIGLSVWAGRVLNIVVGAGGTGSYRVNSTIYDGTNGGTSSISNISYPSTTTNGGTCCNANGVANGGSGGGQGSVTHINSNRVNWILYPGEGGSDGGWGRCHWGHYHNNTNDLMGDKGGAWSAGQFSTTRAFGESSGTLYAGGGGGGIAESSDSNTHGGDGCYANGGGGYGASWRNADAENGRSGIVIIRWGY